MTTSRILARLGIPVLALTGVLGVACYRTDKNYCMSSADCAGMGGYCSLPAHSCLSPQCDVKSNKLLARDQTKMGEIVTTYSPYSCNPGDVCDSVKGLCRPLTCADGMACPDGSTCNKSKGMCETIFVPPAPDMAQGDMNISPDLAPPADMTPGDLAGLPNCPDKAVNGGPSCNTDISGTTCRAVFPACGKGFRVAKKADCHTSAPNFAGQEGSDGFCLSANAGIEMQVATKLGATKLQVNSAGAPAYEDIDAGGKPQLFESAGAYNGLFSLFPVDGSNNPINGTDGNCWILSSISGARKTPFTDLGGVKGCKMEP